jgi:hypothetical protein
MTENDAVERIRDASGGTLTENDIRGLVGCTPQQLAAILKMYADLGGPVATKTFWEFALDLIKQVPASTWVQLAKDLGSVIVTLAFA